MNTKGLSIFHDSHIAALAARAAIGALAAFAGLAAGSAAAATSTTTIYQDNFTGSATLGTLNGAAPTIDNGNSATWTAASAFADSGYTSDGGSARQNAYLAFTPVSGQIYTLTAGLDVTGTGISGTPASSGNYWAALGFMTDQSTTGGWDGSGASPWVLSGYQGANDLVATGPGLGGAQAFNPGVTSGVNTYSIVLNTSSPAYSYQTYLTNSAHTNLEVGSGTFGTNPAITAVGLQNGLGIARVSNFSLTDTNTASGLINATVDYSAAGAVIPQSFLGLSVEYGLGSSGSVGALFGSPSLSATSNLINRLALLQEGALSLRIGGNSEDTVQWSNATAADSSYMAQTAQDLANVAKTTNGKLIVGLNLKTGTPAMDELWINEALNVIGAKNIQAWELGNEPDEYEPSYASYLSQWQNFVKALNTAVPQTTEMMAGPAFASPFVPDAPGFVQSEHSNLSVVTIHDYPLFSQNNPTISDLLSNATVNSEVSHIQPTVTASAAYGIPMRVGEFNSVAGGGLAGVSNTFADTLWALDSLFAVASTGVSGVNFHMASSLYAAFYSTPNTAPGDTVQPLYYAMWMFAQAAPAGSQIIPISFSSSANVKIWMTRDGNVDHIVIINKDLTQNVVVQFRLPTTAIGSLELLTAPSATSTNGITLGGMTFDGTTNGMPIGTPNLMSVIGDNGLYTINSNSISAEMLTIAVPDVSPLALLAAGAAGMLLLQRRRSNGRGSRTNGNQEAGRA
ncbi:MAG: glycosyl hydrolase family 79 C-terminal domain-containing protein [Phycisphaerae bacterium]